MRETVRDIAPVSSSFPAGRKRPTVPGESFAANHSRLIERIHHVRPACRVCGADRPYASAVRSGTTRRPTREGMMNRYDAPYRATSYVVGLPSGRVVLRIGTPSPEIDALLARHGADACAFITAWNPIGELPHDPVRNEERENRLMQEIERMGLPFLPGEGIGDDGRWPAERSVLVIGIAEQEAVRLARRFNQRAIVTIRSGQPARLVWC